MIKILKVIVPPVATFVLTGFVCSVISAVHQRTIYGLSSIKDGFSGVWVGVDVLFSVLVGMIFMNERSHTENKKYWDNLIKSRELVLHPEIKYFESNHLGIAERIIFCLDGGPKNQIFALDSTSPGEWWTNNMLGYLALQTRWAIGNQNRKVHRFFVWSNCQFQSIAGKKIIQIHRLFGFETYIISQQYWEKLAKKLKATKLCYECLLWDDSNASPCRIDEMSQNTFGYKSYWKLMDGESEREREIDNQKTKGRNIFFDPLSRNEAMIYRDFLIKLLNEENVTRIESLNVDGISAEIARHVDYHR